MGDNKPSRFSAPFICSSGAWEICLYVCAPASRVLGHDSPDNVSDTYDQLAQNVFAMLRTSPVVNAILYPYLQSLAQVF